MISRSRRQVCFDSWKGNPHLWSNWIKLTNKREENFNNSRNELLFCVKICSRSIFILVAYSTSAGTHSIRLFSKSKVFRMDARKTCTKWTVYPVYFKHGRSCIYKRRHYTFFLNYSNIQIMNVNYTNNQHWFSLNVWMRIVAD